MSETSGQGLTVAEAAKALGVSERTVRRQIKSGKLRAQLISGHFGEEYRIHLDAAGAAEALDKDAEAELLTISGQQVVITKEGMPALAKDQELLVVDKPADSLNSNDSALDKALDMLKSLQQEKAELYAQVAYWQAQCRHLEEQMKLIAAPTAKRPLWRRLLGLH
jgi:excisionase family DNA binding protein